MRNQEGNLPQDLATVGSWRLHRACHSGHHLSLLSQADDVRALLCDAMPGGLPPTPAPGTTDGRPAAKSDVATKGLTVAGEGGSEGGRAVCRPLTSPGASLLASEYLHNPGDGSDRPQRTRLGEWVWLMGVVEVM